MNISSQPIILKESDYFNNAVEMHYALLQSAENIGPVLHAHEFFEVFLLLEGSIRHLINGKSIVLSNGSLTFIRPRDAHQFRPVRGSNCQMINLAVSQKTVNDLFAYLGNGFPSQLLLEPMLPPTINLTKPIKFQTRQRFERLNAIPLDESASKRTALRILLFELVTQFAQLAKSSNDSAVPSWLNSACEAMHRPENFSLGLPRLVELSRVSSEHLARTMQKHLNQTPTHFINQIRLNYCANQLIHGDRPIIDIGSEVGFESLSYFYKLFKLQYNDTPKRYREKHRQEMI